MIELNSGMASQILLISMKKSKLFAKIHRYSFYLLLHVRLEYTLLTTNSIEKKNVTLITRVYVNNISSNNAEKGSLC